MIEFTEHIPSFVDYREDPKVYSFASEEDMLTSDMFWRWSHSKDFSHFAQDGNTILQIGDNGFYWWVVGHFKSDKPLNIPKWDGWKFRAVQDGKYIIVNDAVSSCGDEIRLVDGSKAYKVSKQEFEKNTLRAI